MVAGQVVGIPPMWKISRQESQQELHMQCIFISDVHCREILEQLSFTNDLSSNSRQLRSTFFYICAYMVALSTKLCLCAEI